MKNTRAILTRLALALAVVAGLSVVQVFAAAISGDEIALTWSDDPRTTQTVSWKSNTFVALASIQYTVAGVADQTEKKSVVCERLPQISGEEAADRNIFSIKLTGLQPGTKYVYTLTSEGVTSEPHTFTTEALKVLEFKFLVFGDSQSGNQEKLDYKPWQETLHRAFTQNPDAKFFVNVGDLVETGQSYAHWKSWFAAAQGVLDTIPAMPVLGNHEMYSSNTAKKDSKPVYYLSQFKLPANGPDSLQGQVYSYDYGCVHFAVLDSQEDEEAPLYGDILHVQRQWLEQDLGATQQPWKIVLFHKPPYNNKLGRPNAAVKAAFCPILDKYHVDVVFNGHEHGLYRTYPIRGDKIQKKPQDGTIYYTTGRSGAKYYNDVGPTEWDAFAYNPKDQPCYEMVQVNSAKLTITACKQDGTIIDVFTINK